MLVKLLGNIRGAHSSRFRSRFLENFDFAIFTSTYSEFDDSRLVTSIYLISVWCYTRFRYTQFRYNRFQIHVILDSVIPDSVTPDSRLVALALCLIPVSCYTRLRYTHFRYTRFLLCYTRFRYTWFHYNIFQFYPLLGINILSKKWLLPKFTLRRIS